MLKPRIEEILEISVERLKNGETISSIVSDMPENIKSDLIELLEIINVANSLPKRAVPAPLKRKLFLDYSPKQQRIAYFLRSIKIAYPAVFIALIATLTGTVSAAMGSLPGEKLYSVKKVVQETQVKLTTDSHKKATLQLELANQRINEAQTVIAQNGNSDAAIAEVKEQTKVALEAIKEAASTPAVANDTKLIQQAQKVAEDHAKVVAMVDPIGAAELKSASKDKLADIKQIVATVNEQTGALIEAARQVTVEGDIEAVNNKKSSFVLQKNAFEYNKDTQYLDKDGNDLSKIDIELSENVKVIADIDGSKNIAKQIIFLKRAAKKPEEAKKEPVTTPTPKKETPKEAPKEAPKEQPKTEPETKNPEEGLKQGEAFGGFIPESPVQTQHE